MVRVLIPALLIGLLACRSDTGFTPTQHRQLENDHGQWLSMASAPDGRLAVSYYDRTLGGLGFAIGAPSTTAEEIRWQYERVDGYPDNTGLNPYSAGTYTSLAFDEQGTAWVSYHAIDTGALKVAKRQAGSWTYEVVDGGSGLNPRAGLWTALAIAGDGQPVVVYHDHVARSLRMARRTASGWDLSTIAEPQDYEGPDAQGETVQRQGRIGEYNAIAISGNTEYILTYDRASQSLILFEGAGGTYTRTTVDDNGVGQWPSVVVQGDTLAVAYHDIARQNLKLAVRQGAGAFAISVLDDAPYRGADTALFKRDDQWNVVYFDGRTNDARIAIKDGSGAFTHQLLGGETTAVGFHNEVAQDGNGQWWAASYDYTNRNIFTRRLSGL